jgi:phage baseplate assembly protein W
MTVRPIYRYNDVANNATIKKEIGIGVQFIENGVFTSTYTTTSQTKNQLINYILTNPGERFFNPFFGSGIRQLLFEPNVDLITIASNLKEGIQNNVQNIIVNDVIATSNPDDYTVYINVDYSINNQQDELNIALTNSI